MPQLDKLSFATQYFWLTLFFFGLYFLTVNFFVISVFKNIKLRNMIYRIWYFFLYKFDYVEYNNKSKLLTNFCFNSVYYAIYLNFFLLVKSSLFIENIKYLLNKNLILQFTKSTLNINSIKWVLNNSYNINLVNDINKINIDEI
jgi:hypothetical protein